ncbi:hypothetical protein BT93_F0018 [Corymbia citriodora subsp. variegata]|nr:hypothetical protein BT93_F0018 [Corymbia citriodora subsp. variegata]
MYMEIAGEFRHGYLPNGQKVPSQLPRSSRACSVVMGLSLFARKWTITEEGDVPRALRSQWGYSQKTLASSFSDIAKTWSQSPRRRLLAHSSRNEVPLSRLSSLFLMCTFPPNFPSRALSLTLPN